MNSWRCDPGLLPVVAASRHFASRSRASFFAVWRALFTAFTFGGPCTSLKVKIQIAQSLHKSSENAKTQRVKAWIYGASVGCTCCSCCPGCSREVLLPEFSHIDYRPTSNNLGVEEMEKPLRRTDVTCRCKPLGLRNCGSCRVKSNHITSQQCKLCIPPRSRSKPAAWHTGLYRELEREFL